MNYFKHVFVHFLSYTNFIFSKNFIFFSHYIRMYLLRHQNYEDKNLNNTPKTKVKSSYLKIEKDFKL